MEKRRGLSLKVKITVGLIVPLIVVFGSIIILVDFKIKADIEKSIHQNAVKYIQIHAESVTDLLDIYAIWLKHAAESHELKDEMSDEQLCEWLKNNSLKGLTDGLLHTDKDGNATLYYNGIYRFSKKEQADYKQIVLNQSKELMISNMIEKETGLPLIIMSNGIVGRDGKVKGLLNMNIPRNILKRLSEYKNADTNTSNSSFWVVDNKGLFLAHPDEAMRLKISLKDLDKNISALGYDTVASKIVGAKKAGLIKTCDRFGKECVIVWQPIENSPDWVAGITIPKQNFTKLSNSVSVLLTIVIGISLIVLVGIVLGMTTKTLKPIASTVTLLKNIAQGEGDLTVRLPVKGNDEITDLAYYFNRTIEKIGATIQMVKSNAIDLNQGGQELSSNMAKTAHSVDQITASVESVKGQMVNQSAGVSETSATVEKIMHSIQQLNENIENQTVNIARSSSATEEMTASIASITQMLSKTDTIIQGLAVQTGEGKSAVDISNAEIIKIVEESGALQEAASVIQNIASQTNLLAMNAAIEAAHAGEAGKGFAVVADEIRKLAEESSMQGKSIAVSLKNVSAKIQQIAESSKTVEEKFVAIYAVSKEIIQMSANLTAAMQEQERGSQDVLSAMYEINAITNKVMDGSAEMLKGGGQVADEIRKLDELTRTITAEMNEMASGAVQINNAVQEVNEMSNKNRASIEGLAAEVGKFRI